LQPIRPIFNFLLEINDGKLDFIGCLQVIKIEKQLEKILRLYKVGKVIPKLFDKVVHLNERHLEIAKKQLKKVLNDESVVFETGYLMKQNSMKIVEGLEEFKMNFVRGRLGVLNLMDIIAGWDVRERVYGWFRNECLVSLKVYESHKEGKVRD
jgi:hypothetical protein